ncbi:GyrI-like domain-containing protein [Variovorax sp. M-6]|uniref:AraC family transcriptional regulator n=1 Tax=Variovorax sp. M-6 TaxID=3233041 RepID=UPI003F9DA05C
MSTPRHTYVARIHRVTDHIDSHLAGPLDLATLASVAHFSAWHFHRVFQAMTGETLADRVRRRRLEVAATRLLLVPPEPVLTIAFDVGFGSAAVFTRAFSAHFGVTPTAWRRGGSRAWAERRRAELGKIHRAERTADPVAGDERMKVVLETLAPAHVAFLRHVGPYGSSGITRTWQRFAARCAQHGLMQPRRVMYGIAHDNADLTPPAQCRYDACIEVDAGFRPVGEIGVEELRGGRYACTDFHGTSAEIHAAWVRLCDWLPDSGYQADDAPPVEVYGCDVTLDEQTGAFRCTLCMPVRPL